ncbi:MAG: universal stress protein [Nitrospirota bacterium]|nr:universal stress protein [Nitrospirota bacterium]
MQLLVAVDFSDSSRIVIEYVTDLANVVCGKIWLLHVAEPDPEFVGYDVDPPEMRDVIARRFHKEHLQIQQLSQELRSKGLDCEALLIQGPTVETILRESKKLSVDMVVVGSHGKGILKHLLVGSTSEGVLHQSSIPVLVAPTHGRNP